MGRERRVHTHTHCTWHWNRRVGLTIDFHVECVIFAVTGAVGTEAKALDFACESEERGASVSVWLTQPLGEKAGKCKPSCPLTAAS